MSLFDFICFWIPSSAYYPLVLSSNPPTFDWVSAMGEETWSSLQPSRWLQASLVQPSGGECPGQNSFQYGTSSISKITESGGGEQMDAPEHE